MSNELLRQQFDAMLSRAQRDEIGQQIMQSFTFFWEFRLTDGEPFHAMVDKGSFVIREGRVPEEIDPMGVVVWELNREALDDLLKGCYGPTKARNDKKLWVPGVGGKRPITNAAARLVNIGQRLR